MEEKRVYNIRTAKRMVKELKKIAKMEEKATNFQYALNNYKKALQVIKQFNLTKERKIISVKISRIINNNLKIKLNNYLETAKMFEASKTYKSAYHNYRAALNIAFQINVNGINDMAAIIKFLEQKVKDFEEFKLKHIIMNLNDGHLYKIPTLLSKALEMIKCLPTSIELPGNFIDFENQNNKRIHLHRIFNNKWYLEIPLFKEELYLYSLEYKYLTSNIVKVIVINFFNGNFLCDLLSGLNCRDDQYRELIRIVRQIKRIIEQFSICLYCNNKIKNFGQFKCEYCGVEIDFHTFLFPNILK